MAKNYRPTSRNWIKLWVNEWLDGTTRLEVNGAQRAFWADLLALAGRGRTPGIICSGRDEQGNLIGYPVIKLTALVLAEIDIEKTLEIFRLHKKISLIYVEGPPKLVTITILNWDKYQSEYHRQRKYRSPLFESDKQSYNSGNEQVTQEVTSEKTRRLHVEGEGEVEVEEEEEVEKTLAESVNCNSQASPFAMPLQDGSFYHPTPAKIDRWKVLYPGVDVEQQLRNMIGWLEGNADNRKTRKGVESFINRWLIKEQDRPKVTHNGGGHNGSKPDPNTRTERNMRIAGLKKK